MFTSVSPFAPASTAAPAIVDDLGRVRRQLGEHRELESARRPPRDDRGASRRVECANMLRRSARFGQLTLTSTATTLGAAVEHLRRDARSRRRCDPTPTRCTRAAARAARAARARPSARRPGPGARPRSASRHAVRCRRGARVARPRVRAQRLHRHRAEARRVAQPRDLVAVAERARRGDDRVRQHEVPPTVDRRGRPARPTSDGTHTSSRSWPSRWYSCSERTVGLGSAPTRRSRPPRRAPPPRW